LSQDLANHNLLAFHKLSRPYDAIFIEFSQILLRSMTYFSIRFRDDCLHATERVDSFLSFV
jgi:hypothetical protein